MEIAWKHSLDHGQEVGVDRRGKLVIFTVRA